MTMPAFTRIPRLAGALLCAAVLVAGCSSTRLDEAPVEDRAPVPAAGASAPGGAGASGAPASGVASVDLTKADAAAKAALLAQRVVYFDFDSFGVKDEYRPMLEAHARALAADRSKRMVAEGHTDERGSREYNLALGQKRAEAVVRTLVLLGAADNQLEAVSFGEERPAVAGSNEEAWAKNRRVELKDR